MRTIFNSNDKKERFYQSFICFIDHQLDEQLIDEDELLSLCDWFDIHIIENSDNSEDIAHYVENAIINENEHLEFTKKESILPAVNASKINSRTQELNRTYVNTAEIESQLLLLTGK